MPGTLESVEYERFSFDEAGSSMSLDEAVKKARELRKDDASHFYRVEAADPSATTFRIEKVSMASAYMDFIARIAKSFARHTRYTSVR